MELPDELIEQLKQLIGASNVFYDEESLEKYAHDETEDLKFFPQLAVRPESAEQVSAVVKLCDQYNLPITPRGAGTGLSGGALPVKGGVVISTEKLNRILAIDERNLQATGEPGVITQVFQEA